MAHPVSKESAEHGKVENLRLTIHHPNHIQWDKEGGLLYCSVAHGHFCTLFAKVD